MLSVISGAVRVATTSDSVLERETGIGPASSAWKADALPLSYSRIDQWATNDKIHQPTLKYRAGE